MRSGSRHDQFSHLAAFTRGRERAAVASGACEECTGIGIVKAETTIRPSRALQQRFHIFTAPETSAEEQRLLKQMEQMDDFELIRGTEADPRHPTEMSLWEQERFETAAGISLAVPDLIPEDPGFSTEALGKRKPR